MYSQLPNISYPKIKPTTDIRVHDLYLDGNIVPSIEMSSSRYNIPFESGIQQLLTTDPNPSYILFTDVQQPGLYTYDNNNGDYSLTSPDTITINTEGHYHVGILMNCSGVGTTGSVYFQALSSVFGPIGTVPPICTDVVMLRSVPFPTMDPYVGVGNSSANCYLTAGSTIKIAYITETDCSLTPTACISITKLSVS